MDDAQLEVLAKWADPLIAGLTVGQQFRLSRRVGMILRRSTAQRIAAQQNPDGSPFAPRAEPTKARRRRGSVRRKMFARMRTTRFLKVRATPEVVELGFWGRVGRIAQVHQEGRTERIHRGGPMHTYTQRQLLGFSAEDKVEVKEAILEYLEELAKR